MYLLKDLLLKTIELKASDLHLTVGLPPMVRVNGKLGAIGKEILNNQQTKEFAMEILGKKYEEFNSVGELDLAYEIEKVGRFRVNVYKQKGNIVIALRYLTLHIPTLDELNHKSIPTNIEPITYKSRIGYTSTFYRTHQTLDKFIYDRSFSIEDRKKLISLIDRLFEYLKIFIKKILSMMDKI